MEHTKSAMEDLVKMPTKSFWKNKKVFLTGHTGFKGTWLSIWLLNLGAKVKGYALTPESKNNLFELTNIETLIVSELNDLRDYSKLTNSLNKFLPDIVIHMGAQSLVLKSYQNPRETYETNVMGTVNLLDACRTCPSVKAIINVTSDKCYKNHDVTDAFVETDPLGGCDPYSSSKACSELVTEAFSKSFFEKGVGVATVRAGNVIGGGDWASNRLVPDLLRWFELGEVAKIRNPNSVRPWQHVLEPLSGYIQLVEAMYNRPQEFSGAWNFGPLNCNIKSVDWILNNLKNFWDNPSWEVIYEAQHPEAKYLKLNISKVSEKLGWAPKWSLNKTLENTVKWHRKWLKNNDMKTACEQEIAEYLET